MSYENNLKGKKSPYYNNSEKEQNKKNEYKTYKYSQGIPLAEAVLVRNVPYFLQIINGKPVLSSKIELEDIILVPPDRTSYLSKEYSFSSLVEINEYLQRAKKETLDTLYKIVKSIWQKYIDAGENFIVLCSADTIFTFFQDRIGMTHYLLFIGDNDTGKSNVLSVLYYLSYRPLFDTSITPANIYNFLNSIEEGQGIILEDEIDNIEEQDEKMRDYKVGYKTGTKISRMYDSSSNNVKTQKGYFTYCFKAFSAEKQPRNSKSKGFVERLLTLKCSPGNPLYDISEVVNDAGDDNYNELLKELNDTRKLLLVYRLLHHEHSFPDVKLSIKNRDKQLTKPLIRLFQNTKVINEILDSLSKYLVEKKEKKVDSFDARLFAIVVELVSRIGSSIPNEKLWEEILKQIPGTSLPNKPQSYDSEEFGPISKTKISSICEDKFGAKKGHDGQQRILRFNKEVLSKLSINYSSFEKIEILNDTNTSNTFNTFWECVEDTSNDYAYINKPKNIEIYQKPSLDIQNSLSNNKKEENQNSSIDSIDSKKVLEPLEVLGSNDDSQPTSVDIIEVKRELNQDIKMPENTYRIGRTDIFACDECNWKGDRWLMQKHPCNNNKNKLIK
jgi:hypothetical protein